MKHAFYFKIYIQFSSLYSFYIYLKSPYFFYYKLIKAINTEHFYPLNLCNIECLKIIIKLMNS